MIQRSAADTASRIVEFWCGLPDRDGAFEKRESWFKADSDFDARITAEFLGDHESAAAGELDGLKATPEGCLALVILLDQFPRNMFRGTPRAFATDEAARAVSRHALTQRLDATLHRVPRSFLYLPLEHSENLEDQELSVRLFESLGDEDWLGYARAHRDIIARFGRFPHRNAILGRESTPEETEFLKQPGSAF